MNRHFKEKYRTCGRLDENEYPYYVAQVKPRYSFFWKNIVLEKYSIRLSRNVYSICPTESKAKNLIFLYKNRERGIKYYE